MDLRNKDSHFAKCQRPSWKQSDQWVDGCLPLMMDESQVGQRQEDVEMKRNTITIFIYLLTYLIFRMDLTIMVLSKLKYSGDKLFQNLDLQMKTG